MSSPAQSLASVIKVPSNSLPWRAAFCSFCLGSFGANSGSLRHQRKANARQSKTISSPARKVNMLDSKKHHHFRSRRQSSFGVCSVGSSHVIPADLCPRIAHSPAPSTSHTLYAFDAMMLHNFGESSTRASRQLPSHRRRCHGRRLISYHQFITPTCLIAPLLFIYFYNRRIKHSSHKSE